MVAEKRISQRPRYALIYRIIWADQKFRGLNAEEKLIALYCLTSSQVNSCGIFFFSIAMASEDIGTLSIPFDKGFDGVVFKMGWKYDAGARVLYLPSWWRWNGPSNPNEMKGRLKALDELPETELETEFAKNVEFLSGSVRDTLTDTLSKRFPNRFGNKDKDKDK